jgi:hypothetical protein
MVYLISNQAEKSILSRNLVQKINSGNRGMIGHQFYFTPGKKLNNIKKFKINNHKVNLGILFF